ncbi:MAG TPA: hypothetical protein VJ957_10665 [Longimicrobiales bacterium]|nr:hypothetical protein [Longimicrobiales bacterium]
MRVAPHPALPLLGLWFAAGCGGDATAPPPATYGPVPYIMVAPLSNLVWTPDDQVLFWAPIYQQVTVSPVRLTAVDPDTRTWHYVETVDRHAERLSVSPDGATAWFADEPAFDFPGDTLSVVYRLPLPQGQADTVTETKPVRLQGLLGYAHRVVAQPGGGALYATPPDSLWEVQDSARGRALLATGCAVIQAISADGTRVLCSRADPADLVFITLPDGQLTPFDVRAASPTRYPQGFAFVDGRLHVAAVTPADSSWVVSEWAEDTGARTPLFETSSFEENPGFAFWSGDGSRIAVWTEECLHPNYGVCLSGILARLRVIDRETGTVRLVGSFHGLPGLHGGVVAFAPDDRRIAFAIHYALYITRID